MKLKKKLEAKYNCLVFDFSLQAIICVVVSVRQWPQNNAAYRGFIRFAVSF